MVSVCGFDEMAMVKGILGLVAMVLALTWHMAVCSAFAIFSSHFACAHSKRIKSDVCIALYGSLLSVVLVNQKKLNR